VRSAWRRATRTGVFALSMSLVVRLHTEGNVAEAPLKRQVA